MDVSANTGFQYIQYKCSFKDHRNSSKYQSVSFPDNSPNADQAPLLVEQNYGVLLALLVKHNQKRVGSDRYKYILVHTILVQYIPIHRQVRYNWSMLVHGSEDMA